MDKLQRIDALKNKIDKFRPLNPPLRKQLRHQIAYKWYNRENDQ